MPDPKIDISVDISSDSKTITIYDDSEGWGDGITVPEASDVTGCVIKFYKNGEIIPFYTSTQTTPNIVSSGQITIGPTASYDILMSAFFDSDIFTDGVYKYELSYTVSIGDSPLTKDDGYFYSTRIIESNINKDLLTNLVGIQAYNYKSSFPRLEEIRRRDNILFAIESAEFLSEIENVETLISFLKRIE